MRPVTIRGVGMTPFGRHLDRSMKDLGREAVELALADAGVGIRDIQAVFFANSLAGLITGQECIRGETVVAPLGIGTVPVHNVENACASGGNALHLGWLGVTSGLHDTVLVLGVEKANHEDRQRMFSAYKAGMDLDEQFEVGEGAGTDRSPFVDRQAKLAQMLMSERGLTNEAFAHVAARAHTNGSHNPVAHRQYGATPESVLEARTVVDPITVLMSSPVSDGAAAAVLSAHDVTDATARDVDIVASRMATRPPLDQEGGLTAAAASIQAAYEAAGLGPDDVDVAELHDASVAYEIMAWRESGLCPPGDELDWAMSGHTKIDGPMPINPSGGLIARGHALGASGIAQVHELVDQLRGESGDRQVRDPKVALAQVGGGVIAWETAVSSAHLLRRRS